MKKSKIKKICFIFVSIFVFFSIMSQVSQSITTAVVETKKAVSGKITHEVIASGKVYSDTEVAISIPDNLAVKKINVKKGETVKKGDVLFCINENVKLSRAKDDFLVWEHGAVIKLYESAQTYLFAYDAWKRYLDHIKGWYWKSEADTNEDELELAVRNAEFEYFEQYYDLLMNLDKIGNIKAKILEDNVEQIESEIQKGLEKHRKLQTELESKKKMFWDYKRSREKTYQYVRQEDEKKYREALEKAIPEYQKLLESTETEIYNKIRNIEDNTCELINAEGKICSPVSGSIQEINIKEGEKTTTENAILIDDTENGKLVNVQVALSMEKYIRPGEYCSVKKYGEETEILGQEILSCGYNETDPSLLDIAVQIEEDTIGIDDYLDIKFSKQSEQYPYIIPVEAIHIENGETYVLVLKEASGILGDFLCAKKVTIKILEQNDEYAAVASDDLADEEIITVTDRKITYGSRVRKSV